MKKIYYEVLEYNNSQLKNMDYFATDDILVSKKKAEDCYKIKRLETLLANKTTVKFDLVLAILDDYDTNRYVISEPNEKIQQLESMILSGLTGMEVKVPSWEIREADLMKEFDLQ